MRQARRFYTKMLASSAVAWYQTFMAKPLNPPPSPAPQPAQTLVPRWLRLAAGQSRNQSRNQNGNQPAGQGAGLGSGQGGGADALETALFSAGAALALLDPLARSDAAVTQLWRRRLALEAAAAVCRREGVREDAARLRDLIALAGSGADPGPAGRRYLAWRALGEGRALRAADWPARLPALFDLPADPALTEVLADLSARLPGRAAPLRLAATGAAQVLHLGPAHRDLVPPDLALWLADALLARALGWDRPVPLLAAHLHRADLKLQGDAWIAACAGAWARGAIAAADLGADLTRRAERLQAAAPKLRSRDAGSLVDRLLAEDAIPAHAGPQTSDRAARRLFDRLTAMGLVRELTGRPTFRLYGL